MMQLPVRMQDVYEPRPKSVLREVREYLAAHNGQWPSLPGATKPAASQIHRRKRRVSVLAAL
jgi:hypothetical protein